MKKHVLQSQRRTRDTFRVSFSARMVRSRGHNTGDLYQHGCIVDKRDFAAINALLTVLFQFPLKNVLFVA